MVASPASVPRITTGVSADPLDPAAISSAVVDDAAGAVVEFHGIVRDHDHGRGVVGLDYEAHVTADTVLREVATEVAHRHPSTIAVGVFHRSGTLTIGDTALVAAVSTGHRAEAFTLIAELVDEIKARVPIWKHQWFTDGTDEWVNAP